VEIGCFGKYNDDCDTIVQAADKRPWRSASLYLRFREVARAAGAGRQGNVGAGSPCRCLLEIGPLPGGLVIVLLRVYVRRWRRRGSFMK
jgi:hypothetical protein